MKFLSRFAVFLLLITIVTTMTIGELSASLIPDWTQEKTFACFPSESPVDPADAFLWGLRK